MGKRGGHKPKDAVIVDGFNTKKKGTPGINDIKKRITDLAKQAGIDIDAPSEKTAGKILEKNEEEDKVSAYRMLKDMRSVYRAVGGHNKLLRLIKEDDKLLLTMVKELLKIEASLMATEIRNKETNAGGNTVTFVILKGLQDEESVINVAAKSEIDLEQVADAINPSSVPKIAYQEDIVRPE